MAIELENVTKAWVYSNRKKYEWHFLHKKIINNLIWFPADYNISHVIKKNGHTRIDYGIK